MVPPRRRWAELTTGDFAAGDPSGWVAVLPVAATEQHGPHLPLGTDTIIGERLLERALAAMPPDLPVVVMPALPVGKSDEHEGFAGTLTVSAATLAAMLCEIGAGVARAGVRRLVIMNSHGGNSEAAGIAARELRLAHGLLAVATNWMRLGLPEGLFAAAERAHGIHAGDIETSLMLDLAPDLVRMEAAGDFPSAGSGMERGMRVLRASGPVSFAWAAQDLNADGAVGDAASASALKGRALSDHLVARFVDLVADMAGFDPPWLGKGRV